MKLENGSKGRKPKQEATHADHESSLIGGDSEIVSKAGMEAESGKSPTAKEARGKPLPGFPLPVPGKSNSLALDAREDEPHGGHMSIKRIFGPEDRKQISADELPFRHICYLNYRTANGARMRGTGWLVGPSTVITAGHCVWDRENGNGFNQSMQIYPARNGNTIPASANAVDFQTVKAWARDGNTAFDYGAVFLDRPLGNDFGFFSFADFPKEDLKKMIVNVVGYPATIKQNGREIPVEPPLLFGQANRIDEVRAHELVYTIDTTPGQSGCPVICWDGDDKFTVVGIHNEGTSIGNFATRITSDVFNNIKTWKQRT